MSGLLTLLTGKISGFIFDQLGKHAPDLLKEGKARLDFETATGTYLSRYQDAYGFIKPIGMTQPIPLEQIYTEVQFTTQDLREHFTAESLEKTALRDLRKSLDKTEIKKLNGISAANKFRRLMVLGHPGGGKSTYLQRLGWECLRTHGITERGHSGQARYEHTLLPVLLELKRCRSDEKATLVELLARELAICGFPESVKIVEAMLKAGKLLVLLDALDEVAEDRVAAVVEQATDLVRRFPECRFIISCRLAFRGDCFKDFQDVTLLEFTDDQIEHFIGNWFSAKEQQEAKIAEAFITELEKPEHTATRELARSPVLLGFLCVGYQGSLQLSGNRAEIYRRALDIYLREWNAHQQKLAHTKQVHASLPHETELDLLAQIAYHALGQERFFLHKDEWLRGIRAFMADLVDKPKALSAADILEKIAVSQGLVVQRTHHDWSFSHLTLQEYLAAYHIEQNGLIAGCVRAHMGDHRWREVFLILAGMKPGPLLLAMIRTANAHVRDTNASWKNWSEHFKAWEGDAKEGADHLEAFAALKLMGAAAFLFVPIVLADARGRGRGRGRGRARARARARDLARARARDLAGTIDRAWILALDLDRDRDLAHARVSDLAAELDFALALDLDVSLDLARELSSIIDHFTESKSLAASVVKADMEAFLRRLDEILKQEDEGQEPLSLPPAGAFPDLENWSALAVYFGHLELLFACKKAAGGKLRLKDWHEVLRQVF